MNNSNLNEGILVGINANEGLINKNKGILPLRHKDSKKNKEFLGNPDSYRDAFASLWLLF